MNNKLDLKHATLTIAIYGGGAVLSTAFWYGIFRLFCLIIASWQAGVMTVLIVALAIAGVMRLADCA